MTNNRCWLFLSGRRESIKNKDSQDGSLKDESFLKTVLKKIFGFK